MKKGPRPKLTPVNIDRQSPLPDNDDMGGLGFDDIVTSSSSSPTKKKTKDRYRNEPSPKSILDRDG
jgi:hypothetical protein